MKKNRKQIFWFKLLVCLCSFSSWVYAEELPEKVSLEKEGAVDLPKMGANTVITSDRVEMDSKDDVNTFNFYGNVHLEGEGLDAVCDKLEVISNKTEGESSHLGNINSFEKITALGHVRITQEGRVVKAGHAVIFPEEGKVILTDNPELTDSQGTVRGDRIIFYKNDGKAYVEGGSQGGRPKIILPSMPDLKKKTEANTQKTEKVETKELAPQKE